MEQIKEKLLTFANEGKNDDMVENVPFWDDVIVEIETSTTEEDLLQIGQNYFGFENLNDII
jgi:hypothetical protein